jgi:hypothetical protein
MVVNFRDREISRGTRKLAQTSMLIKKNCDMNEFQIKFKIG